MAGQGVSPLWQDLNFLIHRPKSSKPILNLRSAPGGHALITHNLLNACRQLGHNRGYDPFTYDSRKAEANALRRVQAAPSPRPPFRPEATTLQRQM
jgi:hypothetical protein